MLSGKTSHDPVATSVSVSEGTVEVYRLTAGGRKTAPQKLKAGESLTIESTVPRTSSTYIYKVLQKIVPGYVDLTKQTVARLTARIFSSEKTAEISSDKLRSIVRQSLGTAVRSLDLDLSLEGYAGTADLQKGPLNLTVSVTGYFYLSGQYAEKYLATHIHYLSVNGIVMPKPVLRAAEQLFSESMRDGRTLPFIFKSIEHREDAIQTEIRMR